MTATLAPAYPSKNAPPISASDRLSLTVFLAASVHAVFILGFGFAPEDLADLDPPAALEIILVQKHSDKTPEKADYLAQAAQDGGGESDQRNRPSELFTSPELSQEAGIAPQPVQGGNPLQHQDMSQRLITQLYAENKTVEVEKKQASESQNTQTDEILDYDLEIARLAAELNMKKQAYAKRPKKLVLTASTHEYAPAQYMHTWVEKVERIGNLNYPDQALKNEIEGSLMLEVELKWDGSIIEVNLIKSSGSTVLDEAAKRIVELSSPFTPFPSDLRQLADHLEIVRTWQFSGDGLNTH